MKYKALITSKNKNGKYQSIVSKKSFDELPEGDLLIKVEYSSLNYKDALSATGVKGISKNYPHTPGIDAAGIIKESNDKMYPEGTRVIVTGFDLGMNTSGGFSEFIRVPKNWAIKCPVNLSTKEAMMIGTAGLTAGLCISQIAKIKSINQLKAIVSGATGGVGCISIKILSILGANITGITTKKGHDKFLFDLGCDKIIYHKEFLDNTRLPLSKGTYDASIDVVGGKTLSCLIANMRYNGIVTVCGNASGPEFETSVYPFILRANKLIGIDSASSSMENRENIWKNFTSSWKLENLDEICKIINLYNLPSEIDKILAGQQIGRIVVKV